MSASARGRAAAAAGAAMDCFTKCRSSSKGGAPVIVDALIGTVAVPLRLPLPASPKQHSTGRLWRVVLSCGVRRKRFKSKSLLYYRAAHGGISLIVKWRVSG